MHESTFLKPGRDAALPPEMATDLTSPVTLSELQNIVKVAKVNKAPGVDGIPVEFYQCFWEEIGEEMTSMLNKVLELRKLSKSQNTALVKLIPKVQSPRTIEDYRPISLLCADYKLLASVLCARLNKTLPLVLSPWQRGGLKGRKAEDILLTVRNMLRLLEGKSQGES